LFPLPWVGWAKAWMFFLKVNDVKVILTLVAEYHPYILVQGDSIMTTPKSMVIIASQGTLDWAYPPLILATTAAALDYRVSMFYTFYGLQVLKKKLDLRLSPLGNPAMPMPISLPVLMQALPGMEAMATAMMRKKLLSKGVASIQTLRELALESDVRFIACQMTVDLFDMARDDLIDGIEYAGATSFFEAAEGATITLYT